MFFRKFWDKKIIVWLSRFLFWISSVLKYLDSINCLTSRIILWKYFPKSNRKVLDVLISCTVIKGAETQMVNRTFCSVLLHENAGRFVSYIEAWIPAATVSISKKGKQAWGMEIFCIWEYSDEHTGECKGWIYTQPFIFGVQHYTRRS